MRVALTIELANDTLPDKIVTFVLGRPR